MFKSIFQTLNDCRSNEIMTQDNNIRKVKHVAPLRTFWPETKMVSLYINLM